MGLVDLFRPKWKHSDAEVRATAVRELGPGETEILATIAKSDPDAAVRRVAIKKIGDVALLAQLAQSDPDQSLRQIASEKVSELLLADAFSENQETAAAALAQLSDPRALAEVAKRAGSEAIRRAALGRITDARALAEVARNAGEAAIRAAAVRDLDDVAVLRSIALSDENKEVGLAVVDRIDDRDALDVIAKRGRVKAVRVRAQKRIEALRAEAAGSAIGGQQQQHAQLVQICRTVESLARSSDWEITTKKIEEAQGSWERIAEGADPELKQRFASACGAFFQRLTKHREKLAQQARHAQEMTAAIEGRTALCERVEKLPEENRLEQIEAARAEWEQLPPAPESHRAALERRFQQACSRQQKRAEQKADAVEAQSSSQTQLQSQAERRARLEELCLKADELDQIANANEAMRRQRPLEKAWRAAEAAGPIDDDLQQRWRAAAERLEERVAHAKARREERRQESLTRMEALCAKLEELATGDNLKLAERQLKESQAVFRNLGPLPSREQEDTLKQRYHAARERLSTRIRELREADEWKRWSNAPKQEELCLQVEKLLESTDLKDSAQKLREAQSGWKRLGPAPRDKSEALWTRFKEACDKVYARCQEHFAQLEGERSENLKLKEALCERVESLADSSDWVATAEQIKQAQAEWKKVGAVPREQSEVVWRRFRAACDKFFNRRQEHLDQSNGERNENLRLKEALCEKAEALAGSSDWEVAAAQLKELQGEWKKVGAVARAKSDAVWKRFRKACDTFFDRRQAHLDGDRQENLQRKEALCGSLETLVTLAAAEAGEVAEKLRQAQEDWKKIGPAPREQSDAVWQRFSQACGKLVETFPAAFQGTELDPVANLRRKERLCEEAEALLPAAPAEAPAQPTPAAGGTVEEMAAQLRQALAANAFASTFSAPVQQTMDWRTASEELKRLQADWKHIGPVPADRAQALWQRFRAACDALAERYHPKKDHAPQRDGRPSEDQQEENFQRKQQICERAEELAAQADLAAGRSEARELQRQWKAIGPVPEAKAKALWNRFRRACNRVLQSGGRQGAAADEETQPASASPPADLGASEAGAPEKPSEV